MTELDEALDLYYTIFDSNFPTIPLLEINSKNEVIAMINKCISEHKDVYDMGYISLDYNIIY